MCLRDALCKFSVFCPNVDKTLTRLNARSKTNLNNELLLLVVICSNFPVRKTEIRTQYCCPINISYIFCRPGVDDLALGWKRGWIKNQLIANIEAAITPSCYKADFSAVAGGITFYFIANCRRFVIFPGPRGECDRP